ncbi:methylthioadenosine nucleosidase /adenosylhomocysteine nucleosidase [Novosphingobium sp. GV055]|nr:methylthioadenosine nucleosidase /adenosylhomocysteine nucleosidase [Novosphingobium sp. GV055]PUB04914.1 methylthioadenosine nucleosidase /adenosylhomocysteine nucleosidase [Novosphingobium sp. GV061]PUB21233.1 methylthioadenosine nucleosidase /adenosylhomocysteine nucleosidase [Novosphingobium sp. GV079]PUB42959.1 methylthioadenosine nucleosidase /adenosylhomocysteine nucleosidase [Novosphingobium sp. GV027]
MRRMKAILAAAAALLALPQAAHATATVLDPTPRTLVLTAYAPEWEAMAAVITHGRRVKINDREIVLGTLAGRPVILMSSGVSMVNAAMNTQLAIDHFKVKRVVFSGVAGGVDPALNIGDVAVPEHWGQYLEVMFARQTDHGWQTPAPSPAGAPENWQFIFPNGTRVGNAAQPATNHILLDADPALVALARKVTAGLTLKRCVAPSAGMSAEAKLCLPHDPKVEVGGTGVSAGVYADNAQFREYLFRAWHARLLDMESAAVIQVAYANRVPAIVFRSLSDLAGGDADRNMEYVFDHLASVNAATVVRAFVAGLPD